MTLPDAAAWKRLSPLLDELLEADAETRAQRLAELRASDATLALKVESLLATGGRAHASHFLDGNAKRDDDATDEVAGRQIGAYAIEAPLGRGSTGSVWRAHRSDGRFDGSVAVKLLHLSMIGRAGALRFEREGRILARLVHPNIARLLDAGILDSQPYLVLELVAGTRIDQHCNASRLDVDQRLKLFGDVLAAVAHAHSHLVIHRDIKPSNIFVTTDGTVKLLDFGIAKLIGDEAEASSITADGRSVLTPEYAAPEQLRGGPVTTATDVYALGVLLYRLLVGRHPTAADTATTSTAELMRSTLDNEPASLASALRRPDPADPDALPNLASDRSTTLPRLARRLEGDLENIVARTLKKRPEDRYQTVAALAEDLRRHQAHEPVGARRDSLSYRGAKFVRRNRAMVAAGVLVVLAVAAGLVGTVTQAHRAEAEALRAQQQRDNARRQLGYAKSTNEFMAFLLQEGSDKPFTTAELLARAEPVLDAQFAGDPAQRAQLLSELASLHAGASNFKKAESLVLRAQAAARDITDLPLQAGIECLLAFLHGNADAFDQAAQEFDGAFARLRAIRDVDRALLGSCTQNRGDVAAMKGDSLAALTDLRAALDILGPPRPEDRSLAIQMRNSLGIALGEADQTAAGVTELRRAIAESDVLGRGRSQGASLMYQNVAALLSRAGQTLESLEANERGWNIARGLGGASPRLELNYAVDLIGLGRPREAMPLLEHAEAEARARGDPRVAATILIQGAHAWCLIEDVARCAAMLVAGQSELARLLPPRHSIFGAVEVSLARLDLARGELSVARDRLRRAVAIFDAASRKNRLGLRTLTLLARTELRLGELDDAEQHATQATTQARTALSGFAHSEWLGNALVAQGLVQQARGDLAAAEATLTAALVELQATTGDTGTGTVEARALLAGLRTPNEKRAMR